MTDSPSEPVAVEAPLQAPLEPVAPPQPSPEQLAALSEYERALADHVRVRAAVETQAETASLVRHTARLARQVAAETLKSAAEGRCVGPDCHQAEEALRDNLAYLKRLPGSEPLVAEAEAIVADARKSAKDYLRRMVDVYARAARPWTPPAPPAPPQPSAESAFQAGYRAAWERFIREREAEASSPPRPLL